MSNRYNHLNGQPLSGTAVSVLLKWWCHNMWVINSKYVLSCIQRFFLLSVLAICFCGLTPAQTIANGDEGAPHYPEWMYKNRLQELNQSTTMELDYNAQVQAYIDVYTVKRKVHLSNIIGRSELYFPLFEEYLVKYNLPMELKYLAIVESALDPKAKSSSGAMGLWQFLYHTSRMFDLKVDTYEDERCDPIKSTEAACRYLAYLYHNLNDWQLALAAYNGGLGVVQKAIERSGGKRDFWELQPYLPKAVCGYVPAFIAANYAMNFYTKHDIVSTPPVISFDMVDTVYIHKSLSFAQVEELANISSELMELLNPSYTKAFIPVNGEPVRIFLPKANVSQFIQAEKHHCCLSAPLSPLIPMGQKNGRTKAYHTVSKGEFFHKIAITYQCRIGDIMYWNNMESRNLFAGQQLEVWQPIKDDSTFFITLEIDDLMHINSNSHLLADKINTK